MSNEELVLKYQASREDSERRQILTELYEQNIGIIRKTIRPYTGIVEMDDLMQEAFFGLIEAVERWRPDGGAGFITYAVFWIRQSVVLYASNCGNVVRVPVYMQEKVYQYRKLCEEYEATHGDRPADDYIIRQLSISPEQLTEVHKATRMMWVRSTSEPVKTGDDLLLGDVIPDPHNGIEDTEEQMQNDQLAAVLWEMVDRLPKKESECIRARYKAGATLQQTGALLGVTQERARMIEKKALQSMRRGMIAKELRPYVLERKAIEFGYQSSGLGAFKNTFSSSVERAVMSTENYIDQLIKRYGHGRTENNENGEPEATDCHGGDKRWIP